MIIEVELSKNSIEKLAAEMNKQLSLEKKTELKDDSEKTYTVEQVATMTCKSIWTIREHLKSKILVGNKTGKSWTITKENYLNYINGNQ